VRQHILVVVGNITTLVGNLTNFPAVKKFWKYVKIWRNYCHNRVARFLGHIVLQLLTTPAIPSFGLTLWIAHCLRIRITACVYTGLG